MALETGTSNELNSFGCTKMKNNNGPREFDTMPFCITLKCNLINALRTVARRKRGARCRTIKISEILAFETSVDITNLYGNIRKNNF